MKGWSDAVPRAPCRFAPHPALGQTRRMARGGRGGGLGLALAASAMLLASPAAGQPTGGEGKPGTAPQLGFSAQAVEHSNDPPRPAGPVTFDTRAAGLGLRPSSGAGWTWEHDGGRVRATIREDGTVELDVDAGVQVDIEEVCLLVVCVDTGKTAEKRKSHRRERMRRAAARVATDLLVAAAAHRAGGAGASGSRGASSGPAAPGPTAAGAPLAGAPWANPWGVPSGDPAHDHSRLTPPVLPFGSVRGRYGFLPYPSLAVASFLDRTFEFRLDLARRAYAERLDRQAARLPEELLEIWRSSESAADRRAEVLERWAELAPVHVDPVVESAMDDEADPVRHAAAERARGVIRKFVHRYLPADSDDAFTPDELRRFNAAFREADQFWPYGRD